ncbi:hypothetical protein [Bradyrhizobium sp. URHA0013]|uniref:hypothetical protein n=1 Tax=Bradyrhizobium sp. URHA0013 TaxID=1380352 RepID=UPI0004812AA6|nr:hypothetical protein [Bradyrhizobium sp. URHA0013]
MRRSVWGRIALLAKYSPGLQIGQSFDELFELFLQHSVIFARRGVESLKSCKLELIGHSSHRDINSRFGNGDITLGRVLNCVEAIAKHMPQSCGINLVDATCTVRAKFGYGVADTRKDLILFLFFLLGCVRSPQMLDRANKHRCNWIPPSQRIRKLNEGTCFARAQHD